jgi:outer membrane murein-binding lipoprotein Lpp
MEITRESVEQRRLELQSDIETLLAQQASLTNKINAFHGAVQDCDFWLAQIEAPEPAKVVEEATS